MTKKPAKTQVQTANADEGAECEESPQKEENPEKEVDFKLNAATFEA
jgi:hypothetical protein|tara:strand:+ start:883 stop:1023 length:141 start_codon:yes stop_codon:yes gene_type:complete